MKKIFALILCFILLLVPISVSAEEVVGEGAEQTTTEEVAEQTATEEGAAGENAADTISDAIVNWIMPHIEEISVIITLILSSFYQMRKHKLLNKSMGTLNNNAITVAKESSNFMSQALTNIENASGAVIGYDARIEALLEAYKQTAEDKLRLENELVEIKNFLKTSTDANLEFANELAELLGLANIPNYKKEEIGSRHLAAVTAIIEAEKKAEALSLPAPVSEEVKEDDGEEA